MKFLSVSYAYHDGNMAYYDNGKVYYTKWERTTQRKRSTYPNDWEWMYEAKRLWDVNLEDLDDIVIDFEPTFLYTEQGIKIRGHADSLPYQYRKIYSGESLAEQLDDHPFYNIKKIWFLNHHYLHALSSLEDSDIQIVIDGGGLNAAWTVFKNDSIIGRAYLDSGSFGTIWEELAEKFGVAANPPQDAAGKFMALQAYGNTDREFLIFLKKFSYKELNVITNYDNWIAYKKDHTLADLTKIDWLKTIYKRMGECILEIFQEFTSSRDDKIVYSGGVAQNIIWNTKLKRHFPNLIIPPHCSDEGLSLGGIEFLRRKYNLPKLVLDNFPYIQSDISVDKPLSDVIKYTAKLLQEGKVVAWYQGNGEIGPRALGNRSILIDPRVPDAKNKVNSIKKRENYRPFGVSILKDYAEEYFMYEAEDYYMQYTCIPKKYFPEVTHVDNTCRVQFVDDRNLVFKQLLEEFYKLTGFPMLLNTSLNQAGKPLAGYPENAKDLFYENKNLDAVIIGNTVHLR